MQVQFKFIANVGKSMHVADVTLENNVIIQQAYLAASQVQVLKSKDDLYTADVPSWLIMNKIQEEKDQYSVQDILSAVGK